MGYSGPVFAKLLKYDKDTIYRIENGTQLITDKMDGYIRLLVAVSLPDRNYDLHKLLLEEKQTSSVERLELEHAKSGEWRLKKAA